MTKTQILLTITHTKPIADLTDKVAGRAFTLDSVSDVDAAIFTGNELLKAFISARETLQRANDMGEKSPISDTIWHTGHETLFDFMDAAIKKAGK